MTTCRYINRSQSNFKFEYIGEFDTEFKTFLEYESGAQVGSIGRKKQRSKISCYCPFNWVTATNLEIYRISSIVSEADLRFTGMVHRMLVLSVSVGHWHLQSTLLVVKFWTFLLLVNKLLRIIHPQRRDHSSVDLIYLSVWMSSTHFWRHCPF